VAAGFDLRLAAEVAADPTVDLDEMLLLDHGCLPSVAARILARLDAVEPRSAARSR